MNNKNHLYKAIIFDLFGVLFQLKSMKSIIKIGAINLHIPLKETADIFQPIKQGIDLLKQCAQKKWYKLYILSNIDSLAFGVIRHHFSDIINLFDDNIISGTCKYKKPNPKIFQHLLTTYNLNASQCVFIDDNQKNISTAQAMGITSITCKCYVHVKKKLKEFSIL